MDIDINMRTTILLPVYNDEKYLKFCLDSLLSQIDTPTGLPFEFKCIIGFNGTYDKSKEIVQETVGTDHRFTIVDFGEDKGKSKTLNKLLKMVETERICLIDGDDMWLPTKMWSQSKLHSQFDIIGTFARYIDQENRTIADKNLSIQNSEIRQRMHHGDNNIINSSSFFKTEDALEIGGWREDVEGIEDMDFWVRLMKLGKTFYNIPEYLVLHRIHQESNFNSRNLQFGPFDILRINGII